MMPPQPDPFDAANPMRELRVCEKGHALICLWCAMKDRSDAGDGNQQPSISAVDPAAPRTMNGPTRDGKCSDCETLRADLHSAREELAKEREVRVQEREGLQARVKFTEDYEGLRHQLDTAREELATLKAERVPSDDEVLDFLVAYYHFPNRAKMESFTDWQVDIRDEVKLIQSWATLKSDVEWTPTAANINALPERIRSYIHQIETACDQAGDTRELVIARDTCRVLEAELARLQPYLQHLPSCRTHWQPAVDVFPGIVHKPAAGVPLTDPYPCSCGLIPGENTPENAKPSSLDTKP